MSSTVFRRMEEETKEELMRKLTSLETFMVHMKEQTKELWGNKQKIEKCKKTDSQKSFVDGKPSKLNEGFSKQHRGEPSYQADVSRTFRTTKSWKPKRSMGDFDLPKQQKSCGKTELETEDSSKILSELAKNIWRKKQISRCSPSSCSPTNFNTCNTKSNDITKPVITLRKLAKTETLPTSTERKEVNNISPESNMDKALKESSDELSMLAKKTWMNSRSSRLALPKRDEHPHVPHVPFLWKKKNHQNATKSSQLAGGEIKIHNECSNSKQLSAFAKAVWQQKRASKECGKLYKQEFAFMKARFKTRGSYVGYKAFNWSLEKDLPRSLKSSTFLARRKQFVIKNTKFKVFKAPALTEYRYEILPSGQAWHTHSNSHRRQSFMNRRQAFLYKRPRNQNKWISTKSLRDIEVSQRSSSIPSAKRKGIKHAQNIFTSCSGKRFVTDVRGYRLKRASLDSGTPLAGGSKMHPVKKVVNSSGLGRNVTKYKITRRPSSTPTTTAKLAASRMVKKRLTRLHQQNLRKFVKKQYCMFYNRFGKCKNGDSCNFVHDPDKVAVCTRFLRGTCKDQSCLFSHKVDKRKMPTCSFFLNGACHKDNCPYAHAKVSGTAEICKDFQNGFCPLGEECLKRHVLECEQFSKTGTCSNGDKCKLTHRKRNRKRWRTSSFSGTRTPKPFAKRSKVAEPKGESLQPENAVCADAEVQIKPSFALSSKPERPLDGLASLRTRRFNWKTEREDHLKLVTLTEDKIEVGK